MLTRLYVNNYRCFVGFEFRPGARSLLVGVTGTGKSSILDVLAAIQDLVVWNKDATEVFPAATVTRFSASTTQRFELDVDSPWGRFRYALLLAHDVQREEATISSEEVTLEGRPLYRFADREVQLYRDDHSPANDTFTFTPHRSFLASLEPKPVNTRLTWLRNFIAGIWVLRFNPVVMTALATDAHFLARDGANFAGWCRYLLEERPDGVQQAQEALREIITGFVSVRMQSLGRAKVLVVKFQGPGGTTYELDFDTLSDGQRVLMALYMILHAIVPEMTVLCLDEPDNFVSIREIQPFLVELSNVIEDQEAQALLISHSPEIIDYIGTGEALLLERPDGGQTRIGSITAAGPLRLSELMARGWHASS